MSNLVGAGSRYTDQDRREAVATHLVTGNVQATARLTGIPRQTLCGWRKTEWWELLTSEARQETTEKIIAGYTEIVELALAETMDRLKHGDAVFHQR